MVHRSSGMPAHWQEHVDGKPTYDPAIPPKAPNKFTGAIYLKGNMGNCMNSVTALLNDALRRNAPWPDFLLFYQWLVVN